MKNTINNLMSISNKLSYFQYNKKLYQIYRFQKKQLNYFNVPCLIKVIF